MTHYSALTVNPEISALMRRIKRFVQFQAVMIIAMVILLPNFANPALAWTMWLDAILPNNSSFTSPFFPLKSKMISYYVAFSSVLCGLVFSFRYYHDLETEAYKRIKGTKMALKTIAAVSIMLGGLLWLYFSGFFSDISLQELQEHYEHQKLHRSRGYDNNHNLITFPLIQIGFSWLLMLSTMYFPVACVVAFFGAED